MKPSTTPAFLLSILIGTAGILAGNVTLAWDPVDDEIRTYRVYWGTRPGVYHSFIDIGTTPAFTLTGLDERVRYYIAVTAVDYWGNESPFSNEVSTIENEQNTHFFRLLNIFPNPFNLTTTISFSVQQPMQIKLALYDLKGRHVRTLENGVFASGEFRTLWDGLMEDGKEAPSGIYFCVLSSKQLRLSRSLVLLR